jgi:hypothetical protein
MKLSLSQAIRHRNEEALSQAQDALVKAKREFDLNLKIAKEDFQIFRFLFWTCGQDFLDRASLTQCFSLPFRDGQGGITETVRSDVG